MDLSYCVVNTDGRDYLRACLAAIARTHPAGVEHEVLVLDNASADGSAQMVAEEFPDARLVARERRIGKAENDSALLREARGEFCLLLNEDSELLEGATAALLEAMRAHPRAGAAGAQLLTTEGEPTACAWRLPGVDVSLAAAVLAHRRYTVQSTGTQTREVGWAQSSALMVRREAARGVHELDPAFFVYGDETDFAKRLHDAGWSVLFVPSARATHHDQLTTDLAAARPRIVEFHRNRDRYLRKHLSLPQRLACRALGAWFYALYAAAAAVLPGRDPRRFLLQARQELTPGRGTGIAEAAAAYNRKTAAQRGAP